MDLSNLNNKLKFKGELIKYDPRVMGVTQSLLTTWLSCERKARYYLLGLQNTNSNLSPALVFGSLFHDYQEIINTAIMNKGLVTPSDVTDNIKDMTNDLIMPKWNDVIKTSDKKTSNYIIHSMVYLEKLLPLYYEHWSSDFKISWREVESEFNVKTDVQGIKFRGKRDGLYYDNVLGRLMLMEHKTKSRVDLHSIQLTLSKNFQVLCYLISYFLENKTVPDGVTYNIVRKTSLRQKSGETQGTFITRCIEDVRNRPQFYFIRFNHLFTLEDKAQFFETFNSLLQKFYNWWSALPELDLYNTNTCTNMFGSCGYLDYCMSGGKDCNSLDIKEKLFSELSS